MAAQTPHDRITRDDLESKLRELEGEAQTQVESVRPTLIAVGAGAVALLLLTAFLLGTRKGRKRSTVVEIRRV